MTIWGPIISGRKRRRIGECLFKCIVASEQIIQKQGVSDTVTSHTKFNI